MARVVIPTMSWAVGVWLALVLHLPASWSFMLPPSLQPKHLAKSQGLSGHMTHTIPPIQAATPLSHSSLDRRRGLCRASLANLMESTPTTSQRFIFFGGKGGVGKTSTSAAVAVSFADQGFRTLVISTDPAHSLGDVLDQKLSGVPMPVFGCDGLWAMEVDTAKSLKKFQDLFRDLDLNSLGAQFGVSQETLQGLGLEDFIELLENPPPGIDELIALAEVVKLAEKAGKDDGFDRVVIDTAPTGHTLRLLSFPDFLDNFLGKLIKLQFKLSQILTTLGGLFGDSSAQNDRRMNAADKTFKKIQEAKEQIAGLKELLHDKSSTEFCIVTIATQLAMAESKRLLRALKQEGVAVRHVVVNKLVQDEDQTQHMKLLIRGQDKMLSRLEKGVVSKAGLSIVKVPYFDAEVRGVYPLKFMADVAFKGEAFKDLLEGGPKRRFVVMGGKGGVGKTSSSAALAVKLADEGFTTLVVSTDPAHSLGDSLDMDLSSGKVTEVAGLYGAAKLYALEVDTREAVDEFKALLKGFAGPGGEGGEGLVGQLNLQDFADVFDSAPPGSDELVALARVVKLLETGTPDSGRPFDRIVIDTAPTGHTLRLLSFPEFLDEFLGRIIRVRDKLAGPASLLRMFAGGSSSKRAAKDTGEDEQKDRLREFQYKMMQLNDLLHDSEQAEFVVVTIPTELAVAETERLVQALQDGDMAVRRVIVNQVLKENSEKGYWDRMRAEQMRQVKDMEGVAKKEGLTLTRVPYFDTELKSVYALRVLANELVKQNDKAEAAPLPS